MLTNNFFSIFSQVGTGSYAIPVKKPDGTTVTPTIYTGNFPSTGTSYSHTLPYIRGAMAFIPIGVGKADDNYAISAINFNRQDIILFRIGSGTTEATENDYNLESDLYASVHNETPLLNVVKEDNKVTGLQYKQPFTNITEQNIVVSEIGIFASVATYQGTGNTVIAMIDRTVLDTPITVEPGQTIYVSAIYTLPV